MFLLSCYGIHVIYMNHQTSNTSTDKKKKHKKLFYLSWTYSLLVIVTLILRKTLNTFHQTKKIFSTKLCGMLEGKIFVFDSNVCNVISLKITEYFVQHLQTSLNVHIVLEEILNKKLE